MFYLVRWLNAAVARRMNYVNSRCCAVAGRYGERTSTVCS